MFYRVLEVQKSEAKGRPKNLQAVDALQKLFCVKKWKTDAR